MRVLDLYCGEGGAGRGYADAGFEVVGVDWKFQKRYPYAFVKADVLTLDLRFLRFFDLIHASPPCQFATALNNDKSRHLNLIPATRDLLRASGVPYVIENVPGARGFLLEPIMLNGFAFRLGARTSDGTFYHLDRERWFETSWGCKPPRPVARQKPVIGVYGGHVRNRAAAAGGRGTVDFVGEDKPKLAAEAMGAEGMTMGGLSEAIPPMFAQWIGQDFIHRGSRS